MKIQLTDHAIERLIQRNLPDPREVELTGLTRKAKQTMKRKMQKASLRATLKRGPVMCYQLGGFTAVYIFRWGKEKDTVVLITAYWLPDSR